MFELGELFTKKTWARNITKVEKEFPEPNRDRDGKLQVELSFTRLHGKAAFMRSFPRERLSMFTRIGNVAFTTIS